MNTPGGQCHQRGETPTTLLLALAHPVAQADASMKARQVGQKKFTGQRIAPTKRWL